MKTRFNALDIAAVVLDLQRIVDMYMQSVYDIKERTFLLKFTRSEQKELVLVESGVRIHSTAYDRDKPLRPSGFVTKLRKHLKNRRVTSVKQLGIDRVCVFEFFSFPQPHIQNYSLYFEFYAAGNVILTDGNNKILSVLRMPRQTGDEYSVGHELQLHPPVQIPKYTRAGLLEMLAENTKTAKNLFRTSIQYPGYVVEHALATVLLDPGTVITPADIDAVMATLNECECLVTLQIGLTEGFIILAKNGEDYVDVVPVSLAQYANCPVRTFSTFNEAADVYFSEMESQRALQKMRQQDDIAARKLRSVEEEHQRRIEELQMSQVEMGARAALVEINSNLVDGAILAVNSLVATSMDWQEIEDLVAEEKLRQSNPVAEIIDRVDLAANHIFVTLSCEGMPLSGIPIDLSKSAYANARHLFVAKKSAASKEQKTIDASEFAMKSAENAIRSSTKKVEYTPLAKIRKPYWFEKFHWFITSENFLVVGGRDMHQNEVLVRRHLADHDIYVHADLHGAPSLVIKVEKSTMPPPSSLEQAGCMALCLSRAWEQKFVESAWWVYGHQVSKSAPSGEYLTTGSFMIRGKKNFLPPSQLVYGLGVLFKIDDESLVNHMGEREPTYQQEVIENEEDDLIEQLEAIVTEEVTIVDDPERFKPQKQRPTETIAKEETFKESKTSVRGKKGKEQKIKRKYADQDDEERELAMKLFMSAQGPQPKGKKEKAALEKKKQREENAKIFEEKRIQREEKAKIAEEKRLCLAEQTIADEHEAEQIEEEMRIALNTDFEIRTLTGNIHPEDTSLFAIPVCAPYNALHDYKFRVKLIPGSMKKGKATKLCLSMFLKSADSREKELMNSIHDNEWIACMRPQVKVYSPKT